MEELKIFVVNLPTFDFDFMDSCIPAILVQHNCFLHMYCFSACVINFLPACCMLPLSLCFPNNDVFEGIINPWYKIFKDMASPLRFEMVKPGFSLFYVGSRMT